MFYFFTECIISDIHIHITEVNHNMNKKTEQLLRKTPVICIVAGICSFLWGSAFPFIKIGYEQFAIAADDTGSQILFAGIRFTVAGILAAAAGSLMHKKPLLPQKTDLVPICILSLFQTILQYFFFYIGMANTSGVKGSVIIGANVFVSIIIAALVFRTEKITLKTVIGSIIGFSGIVLINLTGLTDGSMKFTGEGFVFLSTVAYSFSSCIMKRYSAKHNTFILSSYQFIFGGIVMILGGLIMGGVIHTAEFSAVTVLLYLAFISAAAYTLWSTLLKYNDVSKVAVFGFMNPMFGFILSALLLNEKSEAFGIKGILAIILVCLGIFIVNKNKCIFIVNKNKTVAKTQ